MEKGLTTYKDYVSVSPSRIVRYSKATRSSTGCWMPYELPTENKQNGLMSVKSRRAVNLIIDWMILLAVERTSYNPKFKSWYKWKLNFITLTLCEKQKHSDKVIKEELLQPFIEWLRKTYNVEMYFWRAESQHNGNIHFHLCTNVFIPWQIISMKWNLLQFKLGYTSYSESLYKHSMANGIDVHSLRKIKKIAAYLSKYVGKNALGITVLLAEKKNYNPQFSNFARRMKWNYPPKKAKFFRPIYGRLWGCNEKLSKLKTAKCEMTYTMKSEIQSYEIKNPPLAHSFDYIDMWSYDYQNAHNNNIASFGALLTNHINKIWFSSS